MRVRVQGRGPPAVAVGGRIAGTWRHERRGRGLRVALSASGSGPATVRERTGEEPERLARFLGTPLSALDWAAD